MTSEGKRTWPINRLRITESSATCGACGNEWVHRLVCFPHLDSPSVFARILDNKNGGYFQVAALDRAKSKQLYWLATNVLITRFLSSDGVGEVTDYMPVGAAPGQHGYHEIIRRVRVVRGSLNFRVDCQPAAARPNSTGCYQQTLFPVMQEHTQRTVMFRLLTCWLRRQLLLQTPRWSTSEPFERLLLRQTGHSVFRRSWIH